MIPFILAIVTAVLMCIPAMALERVEATADRAEAVATLAAEPIYVTENFEDFELGKIPGFKNDLTSANKVLALNEFIHLDANAVVPGAAPAPIWLVNAQIVVDEVTGSKCLEIECPSYAFINIFGDARDTAVLGVEGLRYHIRSLSGDFPMTFYAGYNPVADTNVNHKDSATVTDAWSAMQYVNTNPSVDFFGAVSPTTTNAGVETFKFRIDNIHYWKLPEGYDYATTYTATFANSTGGPDATFPAALTKPFAATGAPATFSTTKKANLPTGYSANYEFLGYSFTDNGPVLTVETKPPMIGDITVYAVWKAKTPEMQNLNQVRNDKYVGIRFVSLIDLAAAYAETTEEYGFVVTLEKFLTEKGLTAEDFTAETDVQKVQKYAYNKANGTDVYFDKTGAQITGVVEGTNQAVTAVITGIPESGKDENVTVRSYITIGGTTFYGNSQTTSYNAVQAAQ